ncbi:MAG TPA: hypothetical protein QF468_14085 [Nitrospinota bacterium]|nr:hypothetical protein [Nitrospinota bacterium]|tara:strand:- start:2158 stop:2481 length:324 start_codon:yes stop_codon:yes gene_type:complete
MAKFKMYSKSIESACIFEISVGTTGYCGGDAGHGGVTIVELKTTGDMKTKNSEDGVMHILCGDSELDSIIEAMEFATDTLKRERNAKTVELVNGNLKPERTFTAGKI